MTGAVSQLTLETSDLDLKKKLKDLVKLLEVELKSISKTAWAKFKLNSRVFQTHKDVLSK